MGPKALPNGKSVALNSLINKQDENKWTPDSIQ